MTESANPAVRRFIRHIREQCSQRATSDPANPRMRDSLLAEWRRTPELVALTPADDEMILREILRGTGT